MDANQIKVLIWRDLSHRPGQDDNSPPAWTSHRKRRAAVKRIFEDPAYDKREEGGNRLNNEERTHELVEFVVWFIGLPAVKVVAIYIGGKVVDKLADEVINGVKAMLADLWQAWSNKEIQNAEVQLPNGQKIDLNMDGTFYPPDVRVEKRVQ